MRRESAFAAALLAGFLVLPGIVAAQKVTFEPVRAPSKGPENAKVTIYEVADFM